MNENRPRLKLLVGACLLLVLAVLVAAPYAGGPDAVSGPLSSLLARLPGSAPARVRFYDCETPGGRVLSSSPCGADAHVHEIDPAAVNHFHGAAAAASPGGGVNSVRQWRTQAEAQAQVDAQRRAAAASAAE